MSPLLAEPPAAARYRRHRRGSYTCYPIGFSFPAGSGLLAFAAADGKLLKADANAQYAAVIEIDLAEVTEPILACPNDPDDVKILSEVAGAKIDEVFIDSCMTHIGHFRAAGKVLEG